MKLLTTLSLILCYLFFADLVQADEAAYLTKQRHTFQKARDALNVNNIKQYKRLNNKLDNYPLQGYLEYLYHKRYLTQQTNKSIKAFLEKYPDTFFSERLRNSWLNLLAQRKNWTSYLSFYQEPQSSKRQCYYLQALIHTNNVQDAFNNTKPLWLIPKSQHKACDPAFKAWEKSGGLTKQLVDERLWLALEHNQFSLARYLATKSNRPMDNQEWVKLWKHIHKSPATLLKQLPAKAQKNQEVSLSSDNPTSRKIIIHGLTRLARRSPEQAFLHWKRLKTSYQFSQLEDDEIRASIGKWAALNRDPKALIYFGETATDEWKARAAIWQQNWQVTKKAITALPSDLRETSRWQYWLAKSNSELGQTALSETILTAVMKERDYYGFLAADSLSEPYQMNHHPIKASQAELKALSEQPALRRLHEFYMQGMTLEANREAYYLKQTRSAEEIQLIANLTHQWGWHNQTIALLGKAKYWDALDLRFPLPYYDLISEASEKQNLNPSWLLAISRQESAFNPRARSHAGARGLMQLMPNTGKLTAKLIRKPLVRIEELYQADRNIQLGSAYLKKLYDENQKNAVLATASYNAGPHRVKRWLPDKQLDATIWAENIPFNETRHYVQTVMSYAAIFDYQREIPIRRLSKRMPPVQPKN